MTQTLEEEIREIILLDPDIHKPPDTHIMDMIMEAVSDTVEEIIGSNEDIDEVHKFFKPKSRKEKNRFGREYNVYSGAYDYVGGEVNGRNKLRAEQRQRMIQLLKGKDD